MGTDQYSPIISEAEFQQVQSIKESRNTQTDYDRDQVISTGTTEMLCGNCGCPVKRIRDHHQVGIQIRPKHRRLHRICQAIESPRNSDHL